MKLKALYYPYARSFDRLMLKQAILLFDEICFSDPMERAIREAIFLYEENLTEDKSKYEQWQSIKDDYEFLCDKGIFKIFDPRAIVREYDGLMAQSLICDMHDDEFIRLATESAKGYWGILRKRLDDDVFDFLIKQSPSDIDSFRTKGTRFWEIPTSIKWPGSPDQYMYASWQDFSSPYMMTVEHDYIPISCGYSININHALLISQVEGLTLFTDDPASLRLLNLKYLRAKSQTSAPFRSSLIIKRTPEYFAKHNLLAINIIQALFPSQELDRRSFEEIVRFKEANQEIFEHFRSYLFELTSEINSEVWTEALEAEILKILDTKVIPEAIKVRDNTRSAYEKMFGSMIKKTAATVTPTLVASILSGLSSGQILTLSCAAVAGALSIALPDIIDFWQGEQQNKRNGLSFLLNMRSKGKTAGKG